MVKKRKAAAAAAPSPTQPKKILKKKQPADEQPPKVVEEEQPQPPQETRVEQPVAAAVAAEEPEKEPEQEQEEVEEEVEEEYEEEEVEEEEEIEEDEEEEEEEEAVGDEDQDQEPISMLIEPFTKEQLMMIIREAADKHPDVASKVRKVADQDTVHRKIFVHGLGWDTTADTLRSAFKEYGEIEDCKAVSDKLTGKSKGYGFILFKSRTGAKKALKEPQKLIAGRMTACQLAALGPVANSGASGSSYGGSGSGGGGGGGGGGGSGGGYQTEYTQRKIYISNVSAELDPGKLLAYFSKFGEIEEGPLGIDKSTGKFKGFCLFVYKSVESARKALEEPHKQYEGVTLHCQRAIDGPKPGKGGGGGQHHSGGHGRGGGYVRGENPNLAGAIGGPPATAAGLMGQSVGGVPGFNAAAGAAGLNPALGQALTALLASQGAGLGLNNLLGTLGGGMGAPGVGAAAHMGQGGYGVQGGMGPVLGGYQGLQGAYPNQQMGQGGSGRSQHGYNGTHYGGH